MKLAQLIFKGLALKRPIPAEMLDFWVKMFQDFTKVSLIAAFPLFYLAWKDLSLTHLLNAVGLTAVAYVSHWIAYAMCVNKAGILETERT